MAAPGFIGVFDHRNTQVVLRDYGTAQVVQPPLQIARDASQMCHGSDSSTDHAVYLPGIGWQVESYHLSPGDGAWVQDAQAGNISQVSGTAILAASMQEFDGFAKTAILGESYAASVQDAGWPWATTVLTAGNSLADNVLAADRVAFPGPNPGEDLVPMDRVLLAEPGFVEPWDNLLFNVRAPASAIGAMGTVCTFYFNGPAGASLLAAADATLLGTGQYALKYRLDGRAYLYELLANNTWSPVFSYPWAGAVGAEDALINVFIAPRMWQDGAGNFLGDRLSFHQTAAIRAKGFALIESLVQLGIMSVQAGQSPTVYNVPRTSDQPTTITQVRIDVARGCFADFRVARAVYYPSATIIDDYISLDCVVNTAEPLGFVWYGTLPGDCSWSVELFDENGTSLPTVATFPTVDGPKGQSSAQTFTPTKGQRYVQVRYTLNASQFHTPTLRGCAVYRDPVVSSSETITTIVIPQRDTPPALPAVTIESVTIHPQESDPGSENATVVVADLTGALDSLEGCNMWPVTIQTTYDDTGTYAPIFRGFVVQASGERFRRDPTSAYPNLLATRWTLTCVGMWAAFNQVTNPRLWTPYDPTSGTNQKITDIIFNAWAGVVDTSRIDVPDLPILLISTNESDYTLEWGSKIGDWTYDLAREFLGAYPIFDEAAINGGMMRLLLQKLPPYNNLAIFEIDHPTTIAGDGIPRLPHWSKAYGTTTVAGQVIEHTFIQAGTYTPQAIGAEANAILMYGSMTGDAPSAEGIQSAGLLSQIAIKVDSYNFLGLNPGDPGYPDGTSPEFFGRPVLIRGANWCANTPQALNWMVRRLYNRCCWNRFYLTFTAPMVLVTDHTDTKQAHPRRLRFYDPVQVRQPDGTLNQFLVESCTPHYVKDGVQMCQYRLVTQGNINDIGVMPITSKGLKMFKKALSKFAGSNFVDQISQLSTQSQAGGKGSKLMGLPEPLLPPIQDLDNTSDTFGQFYFLPDYDAPDTPGLIVA